MCKAFQLREASFSVDPVDTLNSCSLSLCSVLRRAYRHLLCTAVHQLGGAWSC